MPRHIIQPEGSSLCGHCCVAMAADVSLDRAIEEIGHEHGSTTKDLIGALRSLGVGCADKMQRISKKRPIVPKRAIVLIHRPPDGPHRSWQTHWMLAWDGEILDPGNRWPDAYKNWRITSYLELV